MSNLIKNKGVIEIFERLKGNCKLIHETLCKIVNVDPNSISLTSNYVKAKRIVHYIKTLKNCRNEQKLRDYLSKQYFLPKRNLKRKTEDCAATQSDITRLKKTIEHHETTNTNSRKRLQSINVSRLNQKIKRQSLIISQQKHTICDLREKIAFQNYRVDKSTQCNTFKKITSDLNSEIDNLRIESTQELENTCTFSTRDEKIGKPYNSKIRQLYYDLRSRGVALKQCAPIIKSVCNILEIEIDDLPCIATAKNLTTEAGIVSKQHIADEVKNSDSLTVLRDATTKKGRHYYAVQLSNENKQIFTVGVKEVKDGKASTYVQCTKSVFSDIENTNSVSNQNTENEILQKVTCFMTDRSATEGKVNKILSEEISSADNIHFFKCGVHPILQFSEVCVKQLHELESKIDTNIKTDNKESITHCLLRFMSKLFYKDGSGDPLLTSVYLKKIGIFEKPIMNSRGNRFNNLFHNGRGTYYLATHLVKYLTDSKTGVNFT